MALKLGHRVTVKALPADHPLAYLSGRRGEICQIGKGPHVQPVDSRVMGMDKGASATCADLKRPYLVDSQWVNGTPQGVAATPAAGLRDWFAEAELELG